MNLRYKSFNTVRTKKIQINRNDIQYYVHDIYFLPYSYYHGLSIWCWRLNLELLPSPHIKMSKRGIKINKI